MTPILRNFILTSMILVQSFPAHALYNGATENGVEYVGYLGISNKLGENGFEAGTVNLFSCPTDPEVKIGVTAAHVVKRLIDDKKRIGVVTFESDVLASQKAFAEDKKKPENQRTVSLRAEGIDTNTIKVSPTADLVVFGLVKVGGGGAKTKKFIKDLRAFSTAKIADKAPANATEASLTGYGYNDNDGKKDTGSGTRRSTQASKGLLLDGAGPAKIENDNTPGHGIGVGNSYGDTQRWKGVGDTRTCRGDSGSLYVTAPDTIAALNVRSYGEMLCKVDPNKTSGGVPLDKHKKWILDQVAALCPPPKPAPMPMPMPMQQPQALAPLPIPPIFLAPQPFEPTLYPSPSTFSMGCYLRATDSYPTYFLDYYEYRSAAHDYFCSVGDCSDEFLFSEDGYCFVMGD